MTGKAGRISSEQQKILDELLLDAIKNNSETEIRLCLKKGADVNAGDSAGNTAVMLAVYYGWEGAAAILVKNGADLVLKNREGKSVFDYAKRHRGSSRYDRLMPMLLEALPDPSQEDEKTENSSTRKDSFNAAALPQDTPVPTPLAKNPPKKDGNLEL